MYKPVINPITTPRINIGIRMYNLVVFASLSVDNFLLGLLRKTTRLFRRLFRRLFSIFFGLSLAEDEDVEIETVVDAWDKYGKPYSQFS